MRKYVLVLLTFTMVFAVGRFAFGSTPTKETNVRYEQVEIVKGDTLWNISQEYKCEDESVQECLNRIKVFNNMSGDKIKSGQQIIVPVLY